MIAAFSSEPFKLTAGALALLVHGLFILVLYISFNWQMTPSQGMVVDIWESLPDEMMEQQLPQVQPEKPEPVIKPKPEPERAAAVPVNADIELKNKKKLRDEARRAEADAAKKLAEKLAEQAERRMSVIERQAQENAQNQLKAQEAAAEASGKIRDEYVSKIKSKIRRLVFLPPGVDEKIQAIFDVTLLPSGEVLSVEQVKSSGNKNYDNSVERAIYKAQPLPLPPADKNMFNKFRNLRLKFSPDEGGQ